MGDTWERFMKIAAAQRAQSGGFERRLFLEYVDQDQ
jgi:hypothetical protein